MALLVARGTLEGIASDPEPGSERTRRELASAHAAARLADGLLSSAPVRLVAATPVLGRPLRAEADVASLARALLDAATAGLAEVQGLSAGGGRVDLDGLARLQTVLREPSEDARAALTSLDQRRRGLPWPLGGVVDRVRATARPVVDGLDDAVVGLGVAPGLLGAEGRRDVLVALENNAELRGTGGYVASFATGRIEQGRVSLGGLQDVQEVGDPAATARRVPAPDEYAEDFAPLSGNTTIFRSWNMSPEVPDSALVGSRVAGALLGRAPDLVVLLDVPAMRVLAGLGGGDIPVGGGRTVSAADLEQALLVEAYQEAGADQQAQDSRRRDLQQAAGVVVQRLFSRDLPVVDTVRELGRLTRERHLKVWSSRLEEQSVLQLLGVAGSLRQPDGVDLAHVSVNNLGANKLDVYVDREVEVEVEVGPRSARVLHRVTFTNTAPDGLVPYVAGEAQPGSTISRVEFSLPPQARLRQATRDGLPLVGSVNRGPERARIASRVVTPRGRSSVLSVAYEVPLQGGRYRLAVVPQPLARPAALRLSVRPAPGFALVPLDDADVPGDGLDADEPFLQAREVAVGVEPLG